MLESSFDNFWYLSPTWTKSPSGTRSPVGTEIALRCNLGSPGLSRHPKSCENFSRGRNPSWSRIPSWTRSPTGTRSP